MPSTGPVYQPTTVSYETRSSGLLAQTASVSPMKILKKPMAQIAILVFALLSIAAGVAMIVDGAADYADTEEYKDELGLKRNDTSEGIDIGVVVGGVFITIIGFCLLGFYIKIAEWRRNCVCPCYISKKQGLARQLQCSSGYAIKSIQIMPLNPSTDPLVSHTQYAPVSELPRPEDEERRNLMPDNKDCLSSAEESDRMLDTDPRIVLRPTGGGDGVEEA